MESNDLTVHRPKTYFEEVIGWVFLILGGLNIFGGLWNVLFSAEEELKLLIHDLEVNIIPEGMPILTELLSNLPLLNLYSLSIAVLKVLFSFGLLKRWEWARFGFITVMAVEVIVLVGWVFLVHAIGSDLKVLITNQISESDIGLFLGVVTGIIIFADIIMLFFAGLYIWICIRLSSEQIKERFRGDFMPEK